MNLWDQRANESGQAFKAFSSYRDLGPERTYAAAYRTSTKKPKAELSGRWNLWSRRYQWETRAKAYDSHLEFIKQQARERALIQREQEWARRREQIRDRGWAVGEGLLAKAEQMMKLPIITQVNDVVQEERVDEDGKKYLVTIKRTIVNPARFNFSDAARLQDTAIELMRLSAGLSTDHVSADVMTMEGISSEALDGEQRDARLLELLERARSRRAAALSDAGGAGGDGIAPPNGPAAVETESGTADSGVLQPRRQTVLRRPGRRRKD